MVLPLPLLLVFLVSSLDGDPRELPSPSDEASFLINSTLEIADIDMGNVTEAENSTEVPVAAKTRLRLRKLSGITATRECHTWTEAEKHAALEKIGGVNQRFMAPNVEEAGIFFSKTIPRKTPPARQDARLRMVEDFRADEFRAADSPSGDDDCDEVCRAIRFTLNNAIEERSRKEKKRPVEANRGGLKGRPLPVIPTRVGFRPEEENEERLGDDPTPSTGTTGGSLRRTPKCSLASANFTPFLNCTQPGEEEVEGSGLLSLCTQCRGFYLLDDEACFPSILNVIHCGDVYGGKCIFDTFNQAHGQCGEQTLVMQLLENRGTAECEDWKQVQLELPAACHCSLSSSSNHLSAVPFLTRR